MNSFSALLDLNKFYFPGLLKPKEFRESSQLKPWHDPFLSWANPGKNRSSCAFFSFKRKLDGIN